MESDVMYFVIDDATYAYEVTGEGEPLVLLHGFTGSKATWHPIIKLLSENYKIIVIDLPGHGQTQITTPRSMETFCRDLNELLIYLGLKHIHLLGYSMGGRAALSFAMYFPEKIISLILESASPGLETEDARIERQQADESLAVKIEQDGIKAFVDFWENISLFASQKNLPAIKKQKIRDERLSQSVQGLSQSLRSMGTGKQPSWWQSLTTLKCPVLLIVGALDHKFVNINKQMKISLRNADINIVENSGHAIHVEQPKKFGKIVKRFLNGL